MNSRFNGFAIALAFPETYCKQAGAWYDKLLNFLQIANNNYYKVGHAAVLLIDEQIQKCYYFDFGRYHAPFGHGRVRGEETDHELRFKTKPIISKDFSEIENYNEILTELQSSDVFHGAGDLYASYTKINFKKAYKKAMHMQEISPIRYGPFQYKGSNCSRFVNAVVRAGKPKFWHWFKLFFFNPLTPTPKLNITCLPNQSTKKKLYEEEKFCPVPLNKTELKTTLAQPKRNNLIPENAKWLSGEGCGSWFVFELQGDILKSDRYSTAGNLECSGYFKTDKQINFSLSDNFTLFYPSTCKSIKLISQDTEFIFYRTNNLPQTL